LLKALIALPAKRETLLQAYGRVVHIIIL